MTYKAVSNEAFISTATDLRSRLKRLCFPVIVGRFDQLREEVQTCTPFTSDSVLTGIEGGKIASSNDLTEVVDPKGKSPSQL